MERRNPSRGRPRQVIIHKEDDTFELDEDALDDIFEREDIKNKPVVVVSVAGAFRKGKSFLLNFFLKYMQSLRTSTYWLGRPHEKLEGFSWRGGCEGDTSGIVIWDEIFPVTLPNGKQVAVAFMDTEGVFDQGMAMNECATIFALSTLVSSIQVYNLSQQLQETDLQHLQLFADYGRLALEDTSEKPFQKLHFLVRDWSHPGSHPYGEEGGQNYLKMWLDVTVRRNEEARQLRECIRSCFSQVDCFLMPYPGREVATGANFEGRLSDMDADFTDQLRNLVPSLLRPDNLVVKSINGTQITCRGLLQYFKAYGKVLTSGELPQPRSILAATAEVTNMEAVAKAMDEYNNAMSEMWNRNKSGMARNTLEENHTQLRKLAVNNFLCAPRMGGEIFCRRFLMQLLQEIDIAYERHYVINENRLAAAEEERRARRMVEEAKKKKQAMEAEARRKAELMEAEARRRASVMEAEARRKRERMEAEAREYAERMKAESERKARKMEEEARRKREREEAEARMRVEAMEEEARMRAEIMEEEARREAEAMKAEARRLEEAAELEAVKKKNREIVLGLSFIPIIGPIIAASTAAGMAAAGTI